MFLCAGWHSFHSFSLNILSIIAYHQRVITFLKESWIFSFMSLLILSYVYAACHLWFWVLESRLKIYRLKKHMMWWTIVSYACIYLSGRVLVMCQNSHLSQRAWKCNFNFILYTVFMLTLSVSVTAIQVKPVRGTANEHGQLHLITWLCTWCTSSEPCCTFVIHYNTINVNYLFNHSDVHYNLSVIRTILKRL